jgi:hypothetical protein
VESHGRTFVPILQPVICFSGARRDRLDFDQELRWQYEAVCPLIVGLTLRESPVPAEIFMDLRTVLDAEEYSCIDSCDLSPDGNQRIAARISDGVSAWTGKPMASR